MLWTLMKWGLPALGLVVVAGLLTQKTFRAEIVIAASADEVWRVLMATDKYPDWNPIFVEVTGVYAEGAKLRNKVLDPSNKSLEMTSTVVTLAPERQLRQKGGVPGILTFDHRWQLEPVSGGTKVTQYEVDRGIGLWFWDSSWIEPAYSKVNDALKARAETAIEE
ncbi:SRPBCC domain-containing protein [Roseibium sp. RKSG952]|uniref:SRPBCC domain-containing protein n=1 Tax=Roseibium sp. RKSG952 TaxID=2529384 RepID=UPI0012BD66B3|nr:SRPBCC domain-containing protein [Roseibium sp. RKSG952]MTI02166.1 SRPBCC domain-containing protein [Roseibium sp. RKSG952]